MTGVLADVLAAAVIAALAGMGIGGGGLLVLYLVIIKGISEIEFELDDEDTEPTFLHSSRKSDFTLSIIPFSL